MSPLTEKWKRYKSKGLCGSHFILLNDENRRSLSCSYRKLFKTLFILLLSFFRGDFIQLIQYWIRVYQLKKDIVLFLMKLF
jgi:hypothetical protein